MTVVEGIIEPLKTLRATLDKNGITRFNSISDVNAFTQNYELEKRDIPRTTKINLDKEIQDLTDQANLVAEKRSENSLYKIIYFFKFKWITHNRSKLVSNYEKVLFKRCETATNELEFIKEVVDSLYPVIAGAIGENSTVKELEKLTDDFYLINDFSLEFDPPIYNKKDNDRIFSIQIDHLLVCRSGVFLLETKNWSKSSVESLDLRSPVQQITRTSYALFVLLNSESNINLVRHHWGSARIPIRNIIVMTKVKPNEEFKHVKVLTLNELNGYIKYFDEIFDDQEVECIFNYLKNNN